jgi:ketosteroid isomerase-like protein
MRHPNAELMRTVDELLLRGDFPGFLAMHSEDVVMHVPGEGPLSGDHRGREGIAAVFQRELSMLDEPPRLEPVDQLGSDDHAVTIVIQHLRRGGTDYAGRQTVLARVEGGRLAEVWFLPEDQAAFDAFFTEAGAPLVSEPAAPGVRNRD